jgi:hypothetical protein
VKKNLNLFYDSTVFVDLEYNDFLSCEVYFSDDDKNVWKFHVYEALGSMHGYKLYDKDACKQYQGARFYMEWDFQGTSIKSGEDTTMNRIEELKLLNPEEYLKRNLITLVPENDIEKIISEANAGDSIVLKSGIYNLERGLYISSDYVSLIGEPGCFIYANIDYTVLDVYAHYVTLRNLYLSHLNSENAGCSGDVIMINSFSCSNVTIENCDINGCGVVGISLYATDRNKNLNYLFKNNFIHNNSEAAIAISGESFQKEVSKFDGIVFENNKIWNNGHDRVNEPFKFKNVFTFGIDDNLRKSINTSCSDAQVYHFNKIEDKPLPFHGFDSTQIIGYINPTNFSKGKAGGILVYERFKPVKFYEKLSIDLCDSSATKKIDRMVIICSDPKSENEYYEEGGEDWGWFVGEVSEYFAKQGVIIKHILDFDEATIKKYIPGYKSGARIDFGYLFVEGAEFEHFGHDMSNEVIKAGDAFFKKQALKK